MECPWRILLPSLVRTSWARGNKMNNWEKGERGWVTTWAGSRSWQELRVELLLAKYTRFFPLYQCKIFVDTDGVCSHFLFFPNHIFVRNLWCLIMCSDTETQAAHGVHYLAGFLDREYICNSKTQGTCILIHFTEIIGQARFPRRKAKADAQTDTHAHLFLHAKHSVHKTFFRYFFIWAYVQWLPTDVQINILYIRNRVLPCK